MTTHFITAEINLEEMSEDLQSQIDETLREQGQPLRWAVTDVKNNTATVEAVVVKPQEAAPSR